MLEVIGIAFAVATIGTTLLGLGLCIMAKFVLGDLRKHYNRKEKRH